MGGNIGTPPTAMVDVSRDDQWNVLELSSFQLETIDEFRAHDRGLPERHAGSSGPAPHVRELCECQGPAVRDADGRGDAVLNADDPTCVSVRGATPARRLTGSAARHGAGVWFDGATIFVEGEPLIDADELPIRGRSQRRERDGGDAAARCWRARA